uniref:Uncharacterized protein n=1 Tax=Nonomuraea gerenzanensis TaxID=93944 RepID=A0A1M4EJ79_9ACTN|nr:hypothetical protein BN4615_P8406 [Nonomuraea gerenzanensis]
MPIVHPPMRPRPAHRPCPARSRGVRTRLGTDPHFPRPGQ